MKWNDEAGQAHLLSAGIQQNLRLAITAVSHQTLMAVLSQFQPGALDKLHALLQQAEEKISTFMWSIRSKDNSLYPGYSYYFMLKDIRNMFINCHIWNSLIVMTQMLLCPSWSKFQRQILEKKNILPTRSDAWKCICCIHIMICYQA